MEASVCKIKMGLVEKLGVHLEKREQLAPVAARILAYIILTGKKGTTFDEMVQVLCASKSTISTHLNHLQDLKKIIYYTKTGDRKKYFIINKNMILHHIDDMIGEWAEVKSLHKQIQNYKETINKNIPKEEDKFELKFHKNYIKFLEDASASMQELRNKLTEK